MPLDEGPRGTGRCLLEPARVRPGAGSFPEGLQQWGWACTRGKPLHGLPPPPPPPALYQVLQVCEDHVKALDWPRLTVKILLCLETHLLWRPG